MTSGSSRLSSEAELSHPSWIESQPQTSGFWATHALCCQGIWAEIPGRKKARRWLQRYSLSFFPLGSAFTIYQKRQSRNYQCPCQPERPNNVGLKAASMWWMCGSQKWGEEGTFRSNVSLTCTEQTLQGSNHTITTLWLSIAMWLQTAQSPRRSRKAHKQCIFFILVSSVLSSLQSTQLKITFPTTEQSHIKPPEPGEAAGATFCSLHYLSYVWGGFCLLGKLLGQGELFRNALTPVPSARVQPEKRLARSPSKLVVLWIANKSNFTSISFALVRMILESSALQERGDIEKTNVVFYKNLKPNTGSQSVPQRDFHHKIQANS